MQMNNCGTVELWNCGTVEIDGDFKSLESGAEKTVICNL